MYPSATTPNHERRKRSNHCPIDAVDLGNNLSNGLGQGRK